MTTLSPVLGNLGSTAAILQLFVTGYLSYKVYELTKRLLELEEYEQNPGKISVLTTKAENLNEDTSRFKFEVKNRGEGRIEIKKHGFPVAKTKDEEIVKAKSRSVPGQYNTPLILDPEESYEITAQFQELDEENIQAVGMDIFSGENPHGFRYMTDSRAGNF